MEHFVPAVAQRARFAPERMQKVDAALADHLLLGLNCLEPGQAQAVHAHTGADKFYLLLSGSATLVVGDEARACGAGDLVVAPAGVPHGIERAHERTVILVGITRAATG